MLTEKKLPSRLISPEERSPVPIAPAQKPSWRRAAGILLHFSRFVVWRLLLKLNKKSNKTTYAYQLRYILESFGGLWVKAGQILSTRADLLSPEISEELSKIKDTGSGVPFNEVRRMVENEPGTSLESVYEQFDECPFAASSLSQLHRGYLLHEQRWVAVKVHKPFSTSLVAQDRKLMQLIARTLTFFSIYPGLRWEDLYHQAEEQVLKELDFRYEESSLRRLKKKLRRHGVYVPDTFRRYSSRQVLVMEFIRAALMSDFVALESSDPARLQNWLKENNIKPKRVARRLLFSVYRQLFEDNLFHADMHPGNIVLLRNSRIAVIDCRSMASLEAELLDKYRMCLQAIAHRRYATAADIYLLLAARLPTVDVSVVKADLIRVWRRWNTQTYIKELPYNAKSIGYMLANLNRIVFEYSFAVQWPLSKMSRTLANLDASLDCLNPKLNYSQYLWHYFYRAARRSEKKDLRRMPEHVPRMLGAMRELPRQTSEFTIFQQTILRRQAQSVQGKTTTAGYLVSAFFALLSMCWLMIGGICLSAFSHHCLAYPVEPIIGKQLTALVYALPGLNSVAWGGIVIFAFYMFFLARKLKHRFEQVETIVPDVHAAI